MRSLICILWWKKAVNPEKPLMRGWRWVGCSFHCCLKAGVQPDTCLYREFAALWGGATTFLTSKYLFLHVQLTKLTKSSFSGLYGNRGALLRQRIIYQCSRIYKNTDTRQVTSVHFLSYLQAWRSPWSPAGPSTWPKSGLSWKYVLFLSHAFFLSANCIISCYIFAYL